MAYITHPPALLLLAFGIPTFLTMQIQLSAVHALRERSTAQADSAIAAQSKSLGEAINQAMFQQSGEYATDMNRVIQGWQEDIDRTIFGPWLNTTTVTLNTTLIEFYDKVENGEFDDVARSPAARLIESSARSTECHVRTNYPRGLGQRLCVLYLGIQD